MDPLTLSLGDLLDAQSRSYASRELLSFQDGTTLSYGECGQLVAQARSVLADAGLSPGDRVAFMLKNSLFYPIAWLGAVTRGAVAVPVNSRLGPDDASYIIGHSRPGLVICDSATGPVVRQAAERSGHRLEVLEVGEGEHVPSLLEKAEPLASSPSSVRSLANVQYTSGTTGFPKGCLLTHGYWQRMGAVAGDLLRLSEGKRILTAQPFSYIDPLWNVVSAMQSGAHLIVLNGFHPSTFMQAVAEWKVNAFYCLGVMPSLLLKQPAGPWDRDVSLDRVVCSAIPPQLHAEIERRWEVPWFEAFGMTETGVNIAVSDEDHDVAVGTGCIGRPLGHCEASVVDDSGREVAAGEVGELRLRGLGLMEGYLDDPEATARFFREGWAHTGDIVERDDEGRIYFRGRRKEFVRRGGENISQAEVEFALRSHGDVLDCAVAPVPDEAMGEEAKAYVVLLSGRPLDPESLRAFLVGKLAQFKVPRYYEFRNDLPRTPSERIAKGQLEEGKESWRIGTYDCKTGAWLAHMR